jgi:hypothetical protein
MVFQAQGVVVSRLVLLLVAACCLGAGEPPRVDHVVVLVIDGPRWSETWGDAKREHIPRQAAELAPQGALYTDFANDGPTYTNAGHAALTTGFYQEINNSGKELPRRPGIPQVLLAARSGAASQAWIVSSKDKLAILADCVDPVWKGTFLAMTDCGKAGLGSGYREDAITMRNAVAVLKRDHPAFLLVNHREPDSSGHAKQWGAYLAGIRAADEAAATLWKEICADAALVGRTALFITNDHGRHLDGIETGYVDHGDRCAGCRHISLLALGPGIRAGDVIELHRSQIDLAVTMATLLGLELKGSAGTFMNELFAASER